MRFANQKRFKAYIVGPEREDINPCCDLLLILVLVLCSAFLCSFIFNSLYERYKGETVNQSLTLLQRVEAKIMRVSGDRKAIDRLICEIRENLAKVYVLINGSARVHKHPQKKLEINFLRCKEAANDPNPKDCETAHLNNEICNKLLKDSRVTQRKPAKILEEAPRTSILVTMSPSGKPEIKVVEGTSTGNNHRNKRSSHNQSGESGTFPKRIRRAANPNPEETQQADDFWFHYAGDPQTSCKVPKQGLKTAEILCKIWPQSISCNTYCIYGSTYPEGIVRTLNCSFQRNRWSDYFEECQPFVNCKLRLIGPGTLKCVGNLVNQSPTCHIGCEDYEDNEGTPAQMYNCKADGTWSPPLPPCVSKKSGVDLVKAPEILEHTSIEYPKM